jgi:hypothetical protein
MKSLLFFIGAIALHFAAGFIVSFGLSYSINELFAVKFEVLDIQAFLYSITAAICLCKTYCTKENK